ncbi:hypothetical protein Kpol_1043p17 [Vanderwaltozyma polyspora DSM 70294]|uniref:Inheritance of peroxisomes protein 2 n=1 Tax=Vanderwaltozyma polyspora (strain ATCC 22028 / DSM 70294 / BCRC 21397 / CBS 2163 / NBRC 10782 / NRRL Y-8283 / UCD 57-17) TaxID=436907 RepID=A7TIN5_VANPO|nr:uncharacterized protein Kpol_1043p17 [Vanderwaltozyma polyspora DSM 70294]EDO17827.1 hypothetical protein Kpol_1043p17 [Vanderwaltozyma polyspora DSM 70294]
MEEISPTSLHLPGLQIFSSSQARRKPNVGMLGRHLDFPLGGYSSSGMVLGNDTTPVMDNNCFELETPVTKKLRNFTDWTTLTLHEASPGNDIAEKYEKCDSSPLDLIIQRIFEELPMSKNDQFFDEFQYAIITCPLLNDNNGVRFLFDVKKSILDFHKNKYTGHRRILKSFPTKFGRCLKLSSDNFQLTKTFHHSRTVLLSYKLINYIHSLKNSEESLILKNKFLTIILLCLYMSFQQELFHIQYIKYKTLLEVKIILNSLHRLDTIIHKYYNAYSEESIFRPINLNLNNQIDNNSNLSNIEVLLSSCLDILFYNFKNFTNEMLQLINIDELGKFCDIYKIHFNELYDLLRKSQTTIKGKLLRSEILQKFFLCCLLSLNNTNVSINQHVRSSLTKIFNDSFLNQPEPKQQLKLEKTAIILKQVKRVIELLASTLNANKYLLVSIIEDTPPPSSKLHLKNTSKDIENVPLTSFINRLVELERSILRIDPNDLGRHQFDVTNELQSLLRKWENITSLEGCNNRFAETKKIRTINNRFSIDIRGSERNGILTTDIDIKNIEDNETDFLVDSECTSISQGCLVCNNYNEDCDCDHNTLKESFEISKENYENKDLGDKFGCITNSFTKGLRKLSDEELKRKLDEKILSLAAENIKGKEKLRDQKSFELLKDISRKQSLNCLQPSSHDNDNDNDDKENLWSRTPKHTQLSSEDSIPVIYRIRELLQSRS